MEPQKKLSEMTDIELKAAGYDYMAQIEYCQKNLESVNRELLKRIQTKATSDDKKQ